MSVGKVRRGGGGRGPGRGGRFGGKGHMLPCLVVVC